MSLAFADRRDAVPAGVALRSSPSLLGHPYHPALRIQCTPAHLLQRASGSLDGVSSKHARTALLEGERRPGSPRSRPCNPDKQSRLIPVMHLASPSPLEASRRIAWSPFERSMVSKASITRLAPAAASDDDRRAEVVQPPGSPPPAQSPEPTRPVLPGQPRFLPRRHLSRDPATHLACLGSAPGLRADGVAWRHEEDRPLCYPRAWHKEAKSSYATSMVAPSVRRAMHGELDWIESAPSHLAISPLPGSGAAGNRHHPG